ncbi:MAG: hypothetical protein F6J97_17570 [Leptolyngbya sp. SIO4C1]|nr:hypothetical protein [Leptolyngbya sp. SIO4C1]
MKIQSPQIALQHETAQLSALITTEDGCDRLWYAVDRAYGDFLTVERLDAFLVGMLLLAMQRGENIYVEGPISEKLFYNLTQSLIKILTLLLPSLRPIKIIPEALVNDPCETAGGVATGFSGGIDSFSVLADHFWGDVSDSYRVTHLIFNNVGSHGHGGRPLFHQRYERLWQFAQDYELPFVKIDSNLDNWLRDLEFRTTHTTRNASAVLALQKLFGKYLYASAHKYQNCFIGEAKDGSVIDPTALHLLSTETIDCISTGCQYSRVEKTIQVADLAPSYRYLDVCVHAIDKAENCSTCWKCARTLLTLEILGKQTLYQHVFDLEKFSTIRANYIASLDHNPEPLEQEVIDLAVQCGYSLSPIDSRNFLQPY